MSYEGRHYVNEAFLSKETNVQTVRQYSHGATHFLGLPQVSNLVLTLTTVETGRLACLNRHFKLALFAQEDAEVAKSTYHRDYKIEIRDAI